MHLRLRPGRGYDIILYIACGMILILFPDMVRLDAKEDIQIQNR